MVLIMKSAICRRENSAKRCVSACRLLYSFLYAYTSRLELLGTLDVFPGWTRKVAIFACSSLKGPNGMYIYPWAQKSQNVEGKEEGKSPFLEKTLKYMQYKCYHCNNHEHRSPLESAL